jgi:SPP1 family predicted phage head-tail adaptor
MLQHKENIAAMDRLITIQRPTFGTDASNQKKITAWANISTNPTVWANVDEKTGTEVTESEQIVGITQAVFTIRHRTDLTVEDRVVYNSKNYNIHAIVDVGRNRFLRLISESGGHYV